MTIKVGSLPGELPELYLFYSIDVECTVRDVELTSISYTTKLVTYFELFYSVSVLRLSHVSSKQSVFCRIPFFVSYLTTM